MYITLEAVKELKNGEKLIGLTGREIKRYICECTSSRWLTPQYILALVHYARIFSTCGWCRGYVQVTNT
jgi:hypothetical protein